MRFNLKYFLVTLGLLAVEILIATRLRHLPFVRNSLGDYLAVILLYCLVRSWFKLPALALSAAVFLAAASLEVAQTFHLASALGLRPNSLPGILIGSSFSWLDLLMYLLGSLTCFIFSRFSTQESPLASILH